MAEALKRALRDSPALASFPFALRAAEAEKVQAGLLANPRLGIQLENIAGSGDVSGVRSLETTLMLSQLLELGSKRERRSMVAGNQGRVHSPCRGIRAGDLVAKDMLDLRPAVAAGSQRRERLLTRYAIIQMSDQPFLLLLGQHVFQ